MKLSSFFIVTFGIGVISYPAMNMKDSKPFFAEAPGQQAEPAPRPETTKTDYGMLEESGSEAVDEEPAQKEKNYRIIINVPATELTLYEDDKPVLEFPVAVGQVIYKTPIGHQQIKKIEWNPWWYPPKSDWAKNEKITPPGPRNPLGPVKLPMSEDIRLHGTTKDSSIGRAASHGCIRMHSKDAMALAWYIQQKLTDKGDPTYLEKYKKAASSTFHVKLDRPVEVDIVYEPVAFEDDMLTVYPDIYGRVKEKEMVDIAQWKLYTSGIDPWEVDRLRELQRPAKKPVKLPISDRPDIDVNELASIVSDPSNL